MTRSAPARASGSPVSSKTSSAPGRMVAPETATRPKPTPPAAPAPGSSRWSAPVVVATRSAQWLRAASRTRDCSVGGALLRAVDRGRAAGTGQRVVDVAGDDDLGRAPGRGAARSGRAAAAPPARRRRRQRLRRRGRRSGHRAPGAGRPRRRCRRCRRSRRRPPGTRVQGRGDELAGAQARRGEGRQRTAGSSASPLTSASSTTASVPRSAVRPLPCGPAYPSGRSRARRPAMNPAPTGRAACRRRRRRRARRRPRRRAARPQPGGHVGRHLRRR